MSEVNKALIRRYLDTVQKDKSPAVLEEFVTDEHLLEHIAMFEAAFPHYQFVSEDMIAEGDKVSLRATFKGTHKGELNGIAPTGNEVSLPIFIIYRIENDKIAEHWMGVDQLSLMQQLEVAPVPA